MATIKSGCQIVLKHLPLLLHSLSVLHKLYKRSGPLLKLCA